MKLTFWGAARQVTGSMFLFENEQGYRVLIDCGLDMERKKKDVVKESHEQLIQPLFPFEASSIHAVLLTHAHLDHSGYLPNLIREGFEGPIYCTAPTYALTEIILYDSAGINKSKLLSKQQASNHGKKKKRGFTPRAEDNGLYVEQHVSEVLGQFRTVSFSQSIKLADQLSCTFYKAGHLLGAAHIVLRFVVDGKEYSAGFSGDIGRKNYPLLQDPEPLPAVDFLVVESTYGNRHHVHPEDPEGQLETIIRETCLDKPGRLIVPAFSIGRTQGLLFTLNKLYQSGRLPPIKVFSDSPMALSSSKVYEKYASWLNKEAKDFLEEEEHLFDFENLHYVHDAKKSKELSNHHEPCIIVSSAGMMSGGRVEHHIRQNITNSFATILIIGYCAEGTLGHSLMQGKKRIYDDKQAIEVHARVHQTDVFSGHGDVEDLVKFVNTQQKDKLKKIMIVHGEESSMTSFKDLLQSAGYREVIIPEKGETILLTE
jgi:metallo-beta-lactamase family protein